MVGKQLNINYGTDTVFPISLTLNMTFQIKISMTVLHGVS